MSYYYNTHIRNLEEQSIIQKQKILAEIYEKDLLESRKRQKDIARGERNPLKRSRQDDKKMAAFLERSRLQAEHSATRAKAQSSMTRSRLEAAFFLRKANQHELEKSQQIFHQSQRQKNAAFRRQVNAHRDFIQSQKLFNQTAIEEDQLRQKYLSQIINQDFRYNLAGNYYPSQRHFLSYYD